MPPEYCFTTRSPASVSENRSSRASPLGRIWLVGIPESRPIRRRFSRAVSSSSTVAAWPVRPMLRRTMSGSLTTS